MRMPKTWLFVAGAAIFLGGVGSEALGEEKDWVVLHNGVSQEFQRYSVTLQFKPSSSTFYSGSSQRVKSTRIEGDAQEYVERLDLGTMPDGNSYSMLLREASEIDFLHSDSGRLCAAKVLRTTGENAIETVKEGYLFQQRDAEFKIEVCPEKLAVPSNAAVPVTLRVSVSTDGPGYQGSVRAGINGSLSGSIVTDTALVGVSITCRDSLEPGDRNIALTVKPHNDAMVGGTVNGKLSDVLTLAATKIIVEKIAADCSEIVLALVHGDLVQAKVEGRAPGSVPQTGKPFPSFARVDLVGRRLVTLDDLRKEAGCDGYIALIFGDFKQALPEHFGGMPQIRNLSLDEAMVCEILKRDVEQAVVVGFVCQDLSLANLYEKWLGSAPAFYVISDFGDPLNVQFGGTMPRGYFGPPARGETLRGQLALPEDKVIAALIHGKGELVYLDADAGKELAGSLTQMNKLMRQPQASGPDPAR